MRRNDIHSALHATYPVELVDSMLTNYENALIEYKKGHWQYFGNEIGQFIEISRRIIEYQLKGNYTALPDKLPLFSEKTLSEYEHFPSAISDSYRIIIPRCLYAMYCLRNKRGMIHKNHIDPNEMDATVLLSNAKWVLAEFFRLASALSFDETKEIINSITCREISIVWDTGSLLRILDPKMKTPCKILCLLYVKDNQSDAELQASVEYVNTSNFKKILRTLHKEKKIEYVGTNCKLSPIGINEAEALLINS